VRAQPVNTQLISPVIAIKQRKLEDAHKPPSLRATPVGAVTRALQQLLLIDRD
jgi:hypothetical protein